MFKMEIGSLNYFLSFCFPTLYFNNRSSKKNYFIELLDQGWPHFLYSGYKSAPQKIGGHKIMFKKGLAGKTWP